MSSPWTTTKVVLVGLVAGLAAAEGCSSGGGQGKSGAAGTSAAGSASAGTTGAAGTIAAAGTSGTGAAGTTNVAGATGTAGTAAAGAGAAGTGAAGTAAAGTAAAGAGAAGTGAAGAPTFDPNITKVAPTTGCGTAAPADLTPGTLVKQTILTMGTKPTGCADSRCGDWMYTREYYVRLPTGYDKSKAYPLLFEGPGCGGKGNNLYDLPGLDSTFIRVGLSPSAEAQASHATNPGQGCFDDKEGDDSVDWVLYENLHDRLAAQLCFDNHRVFAGGNASGSWFSNELACKYAGDSTRPIRGIAVNGGGLPTDSRYVPTCTSQPMAGLWVLQMDAATQPFTGNKVPIARAMVVNKCDVGTSYETATRIDFPIGGGNTAATCQQLAGCPALYPLVVCLLPSTAPSNNPTVVNPAFTTFLGLFEKAPFLTP